jgi:predicted TIM-barrel fold metal-dependent hydrolase
MSQAQFFSADSHVNEPPAAWERIPAALRAKGPHYVQDPPGKKGLFMCFDGHAPDPVGMTFTAGKKQGRGDIGRYIETFQWEDWRGPWDASHRLADMDLDGVGMEVLYPSMARNFYSLKGDETPLQQAGLKSYNDWIMEYCAVAPKRLFAVGMLSALDVPWSVKEMERCAKLGHKGVLLPARLPPEMTYADPQFEPIWQASESLDLPIHFHINIVQGTDRMASRLKQVTMLQTGEYSVQRAILEPLNLITQLIFGLVLDKHPKMRVIFAEYDLTWVLPFMSKMDSGVKRKQAENPLVPVMSALPSEIVKRQCFITFQDDAPGLTAALGLGLLDNCMWASDYPHGGSTWPHSQEIVKEQTENLSKEVADKLTWKNAARFYGVA